MTGPTETLVAQNVQEIARAK